MSKRAAEIKRWQARTEPPREAPTEQPTRPEDSTAGFDSPMVVIRSFNEAEQTITAQRVRQNDGPMTAGESAAGLGAHVVAYGPVFEVKPLPDTPYSFWRIQGLVVPEPDDLATEELGAEFVGVLILPGNFIMINVKVPGAKATDPDVQTSEGSGV